MSFLNDARKLVRRPKAASFEIVKFFGGRPFGSIKLPSRGAGAHLWRQRQT